MTRHTKQPVLGTDRSLQIASEEFLWSHEHASEFHDWILPVLYSWLHRLSPSDALDLGCGNGYVADWLSSKGVHTVGIDNSASGVAIARKAYAHIQFVRADLSRPLDLKHSKQFDMVVSLDVIEHLFLPRQLFARAREALRPGGYLIISTPYHGYWKNLLLALTDSFDRHWHPLRDHGHIKFFSKRTLTSLSEEQGFEVVEFVKRGRIPALAKSMMVLLKERP